MPVEPDIERLVTVCGVGRSGTSLLQSMLAAHSELAMPPETHFFCSYLRNKRKRRAVQRAGRAAFASVIANDKHFHRAGIPVEILVKPGNLTTADFDPSSAYHHFLKFYAKRERKGRIGEKDPRLIDYLGELSRLFPSALIIHIVRDPRDVVASRMKARWSSGRPYWLHALVYRAQIALGREQGQKYFPRTYLEIRYEDLIESPAETLRTICKHIDLPFEASMLSFSRAAAKLAAPDEVEWKRETLGPLLKTNSGKWRAELTQRQAMVVEALCSEAMEDLGYARVIFEVQPRIVQWILLGLAAFAGTAFSQLFRIGRRLL